MAFQSFYLQDLLDHFDGDKEILDDVSKDFLESSPSLLSEVEVALEKRDAKALEVSAHTLKGASGNFLAKNVMNIALELEMLGKEGRLEGTQELLARLQTALSLLQEEMREAAKMDWREEKL